MTRQARRDWRSIGCAAVIGAALAFPAGIMVAGRDSPAKHQDGAAGPDRAAIRKADRRDVYSPVVLKDPYVLDQQRRVVEALELECRRLRKHCAEAVQARRRIEEAAAD